MGVFSHRLRNFTHERPLLNRGTSQRFRISRRHICCFAMSEGKLEARAKSSGLLLNNNLRENWRYDAMTKDDRDILELLKSELSFIEEGGYGRSVRTPWLPKSIFQDSLSCLNYGYPYRAHPCTDCHLLDFVASDDRSQPVPCHFIPLNAAGNTVEELEMEGNEVKMASTVKAWLKGKISQLEAERSNDLTEGVRVGASSNPGRNI